MYAMPGGIINLLEMGGHLDPDKQIIITSCRYDQYSWEYEALQNGCFSYFFLQGLKGAADLDGNKEITLKELEKYSMENVERYVKQRNNTYQFPEFKGYYSHRMADVDGRYQPTDIAAYTLNEMGNRYFAKGELETALEYYQKANRVSPTWGRNIIKTNKSIQQKQAAQQLFATKSPYNAIPNSYEIVAENSSSSNGSVIVSGNMEENVFHIQLAAASQVNRGEFKTVEDLGPINPKFNPEKNLINTWLGPFDSVEEAKTKLKKAKERGFKDAFLVETPRDSSFQKKLDEKKAVLKKELAAAMPYQVRIASVKAFNKAEYTRLEKIGSIEVDTAIVNGKTFLRVLMRFNLKEEATVALQKVKKEGFADAYIFENQAQALESKTPGDLPSSYESTNANPAIYKIRVATVSKLVENQFSNLESLGHIYMDVLHDRGLIRVSLGDYPTKAKALEVLDKVKKLGYKDAFIQK